VTTQTKHQDTAALNETSLSVRAVIHTRVLPRNPAAIVAAGLGLIALGLFSGAVDNGFVDWDDNVLFERNEAYRGLGWFQIRWMFSTVLMGHYVPVTWLTHGLDYMLWGMEPAGYHFTNVVLHAANTALFWFVALRLLRAATRMGGPALHLGAAAAALFFGLHPLRAESVAWITERRDVLSGLFFLLTLLLYLQAQELRDGARIRRHAAALACYLLAILSKSMVMTLPAILILLDVYPFRHLDMRREMWRDRKLWQDKAPYIGLGAIGAALGYWAQAENRFITTLDQLPWVERPALIAYNIWFYLSKTILPLNLSALYELPVVIDPLAPRFLVPLLATAALTVTVTGLRRTWPAGLAVWTSYIVLLSPVMGIVHSGRQLTHDRYSYLPALGFALLVGGGIAALYRAAVNRLAAPVIVTLAGIAVGSWFVTLGVLTWYQVGVWKSTETLWRHALDSSGTCGVCELNLGTALLNENRPDLALAHFERAVGGRADQVKVHHNIGLALGRGGDLEHAAEHFQRAVRSSPDDAGSLMNLGVALMKLGRHAEAVGYLRRAAEITDDDLAVTNFGRALVATGQAANAVPLLRRTIERQPLRSPARQALVEAYVMLGDVDAARREHRLLATVDRGAAESIGPVLLTHW
jgi:tetratricopeptide (TPR) repeat protein